MEIIQTSEADDICKSENKSVIEADTKKENIPVSSIPGDSSSTENNDSDAMFKRLSKKGSVDKNGSKETKEKEGKLDKKASKTGIKSSTGANQGAESPVRLRKKSSTPDMELFKGRCLF